MLNSAKTKEIEQKMKEEKENDMQNIKNQIKALLKCDICNINFDLNIHMPMVAKCGHTYCKKCIYNGGNKDSYGKCPIDNIHHVLGIESCVPNLKLEVIIKQIFNYSEPKIKEKKIICFNHEIKLNNNSKEKFEENRLFRSNSGNKNFNFLYNHDELFNNVFTDKKNKTITNFKINKNKEKKICNLKLYNNNNNNVDVIEELNVINDDKINFTGKNKINDESIETIPINDDKSNANISFKDEFNELLNKNLEMSKKANEHINQEQNSKNNEDRINNDKNKNDEDSNNNNKKTNANGSKNNVSKSNNNVSKNNITNDASKKKSKDDKNNTINKQEEIVEKKEEEENKSEKKEEKEENKIENNEINVINEQKNEFIKEEKILQDKLKELKEREKKLLEKKSEIIRRYLSENVMPLLSKGILNICETMPDDPVEALANFLLDNSFNLEKESNDKLKINDFENIMDNV